MAQVLLKDLNKKYDEVHAVKDVNLHIRDKEFIVLVGPSGCGKSTTLRMVAGLEEITAGEIAIGDRVVNDLPPKDRDIAMVFQNYALYPHMTVYDNMAFGLKMRKFPKPEIQKRVKDAAEILGIQDLLKRKPRQLSGGQRQRVAEWRADRRVERLPRSGAAGTRGQPQGAQGPARDPRHPARGPAHRHRRRPGRVHVRHGRRRRGAARLGDPARRQVRLQQSRGARRADRASESARGHPARPEPGPAALLRHDHREGDLSVGGRRRREVVTAYLLLAPATILLLGVLAYPVGWEAWISLTDLAPLNDRGPRFVGLANYRPVLDQPIFWPAMAATAVSFAVTTAAQLALGLAIAVPHL